MAHVVNTIPAPPMAISSQLRCSTKLAPNCTVPIEKGSSTMPRINRYFAKR